MELSDIPVDTLTPYALNARTHSTEQVKQIVASIREFGFNDPIAVDEQGGIIEGHGRVLAAQYLGMERIPCIVLSHLTDTQKRAYIIAHNKLALNAGWDEERLAAELRAINAGDFGQALGFADWELQMLGEPTFKPVSSDEQPRLDQKTPIECPHCGKSFVPN